MERTLIIIKPDAVQRGLIGPIVTRFERRGLRIAGMKLMHIDRALAERHYAVHEGKPFFEDLISYITSGPVVGLRLEKEDAVKVLRALVGATNPADAVPGTIRYMYGTDLQRNAVHASDSPESAEKELAIVFPED